MSADFPAWLASEAGLPLLEGIDGVVIRANEPARELIAGDPTGADLIRSVAGMVGVADDDPDLLGLVARAQGGGSVAGAAGADRQWRVLVHAPEPGRLLVIASPSQMVRTMRLERRAAATDVAAGVSHEVANALSAIVGWAELGRGQGPADTPQTFDLIAQSARTARSAARRLLDAVRDTDRQTPAALDLGPLLADAVRLLRADARGRDVDIECQVPDGTYVMATPSALFTIAWNLIRNAVEALDGGGRIVVTAGTQRDRVRLTVADDGPGMDEAQRLRAFDPYFTTKPTGTGLGLSMVKGAVEELGGRVAVHSERGGGTRFVVELPRADAPAQPAPSVDLTRRSGVHGRGEQRAARVLVVEDDRALREMMRTTLTLHGVDVDAVETGAEALALEGPYEVALVDLSLADARGDRLVGELRRRNVAAAAAVVTGMSEPPNLDPDGRPDLWLRKPFEPEDLLETVRVLRTFGGRGAAQTGDPT